MKRILLIFNDEDFRLLKNIKEESKILDEVKSWEEFILLKCGVKK